MKKIFLLVAFFVLGKICLYAQYPLTQQLGSDSTIVISKGALQSRLINVTYTDTAAANLQRIRQYPGAQIATTSGGINLWVRNANATAWLPINTGSGNNIYTINGTLTGNRTLTGGGYPLTFTGLDKFVVSADSVRFTTGDLKFGLNTDSASLTKKISYSGNYRGDYKQFTLVDKGYVDSVVASSPAGTVTSIATNNGSGITGGTITSTGTLAIDTTNVISTKANVTSGLAGKLNISDTAAMLAPYLRAIDTTSLSNRINLKLNISDTASMLGNYLNNVGYGLSKAGQVVSADSATLSNYYLRRKDSLTTTNPLGYVTKQILADTAAAIRSADAGGTVTSVGLTMPAAFNVGNSPITTAGTISVTAAGLVSQYIRGDGTLADFPGGGGGGGASISYYLNGSVNQGTFGGNTYYEMNKTPIFGAGTDFSINADGYIAQFITDAGDPGLLKIPGGNWNFELFFNASSGGGTPTYYVELYKYDGTTFTLIASGSSNPDVITGGTSVEAYFSTLPVPETVLLATDRLAVRIYVTHAGRTITLHTEDNNLCQVITTFTTGITALNGLTEQVQYFATGTSGTDFNISSSVATHTFNLPTASATNRGALSTTDWTTFNNKVGGSLISGYIPKATGTNTIDTSQIFQSNGNIGIGTTSPTGVGGRILHINAGLDSEIHLTNSMSGSGATDGFSIRASSLNSYIYNYGGGLMEFGTNNTPRMRITNLGQVGIGTGTPDSLLTVSLGTHLQRGIRASGLPQAPGTKALRIDASGTLSYADTLIDAGGTVTSVATNNGTGITGGTITTSGTLAIDTLLISTRAWRQKGIDSVAALINNNISGTTNFIPRFSSANAIDNSVMRQSGTSIGINTSPAYTLDILETGSANIGAGTANNKIVITGNDNGGSIATTNTTYINFAPFQVEAMRITSSGVVNMGANFANNFNKLNVGGSATIGYTTNVVGPTDGLSVNGSVGIGLNGASTDSALSVLNGVRFQRGVRMSGLPSAVGTKTLRIDASGTVSVADTLTNGISGSGVNNQAAFFTGTNTIAGSSVLVLDGSNIAIGQAAAAQKLSVNGDVSITTINNATTDTDKFLVSDGGVIKYRTGAEVLSDIGGQAALTNPVTGTGTTNYLPKFTGSTSIGNSQLLDNGTTVFLGTSGSLPNVKMNITTSTQRALELISSSGNALFAQSTSGTNVVTITNGTWFTQFTSSGRLDLAGDLLVNTIANATTDTDKFLVSDGGVVKYRTGSEVLSDIGAAASTSISGTTNYIPKFTSSSAIGNSVIHESSGGNIGIGNTNNTYKLDVTGKGLFENNSNSAHELIIKNTTAGSNSEAYLYVISDVSAGSTTLGKFSSSKTPYKIIGASNAYLYNGIAGDIAILNDFASGSIKMSAGASSTAQLTLDASGNLGLGVTPSAWRSTDKVLQINNSSLFDENGTNLWLGLNFYENTSGSYIYTNNGYATAYRQQTGQHNWFTAASGTAGNAISFTQAMTLDASGRLGIGTTNPGAKLQVNGASILGGTLNSDWAVSVDNLGTTGANGMYVNIGASSTGVPFAVYKNFTSLFYIANSGNVGIGTTNPGYALDIYKASGNLRIYNTSNPGTEATYSKDLGLILTSYYSASGSPFTRTADIVSNADAGAESQMRFFTATSASNPTERMRITSGGNVGIGTTSPTQKLSIGGGTDAYMNFAPSSYRNFIIGSDINGFILYDNNASSYRMVVNSTGNVGIGTTNPGSILEVSQTTPIFTLNQTTANSNQGIYFNSSGTNYGRIINNAATGIMTFQNGLNSGDGYLMRFITDGSERMRITSGGDVGIGTSSPSATLDIGSSRTLAGTDPISVYNDTRVQSAVTGGLVGYNVRMVGLSPVSGSYTIANMYGIKTNTPVVQSNVTVTNSYGVYIGRTDDPSSGGVVTNKYALVTESTAGNVGIGTTSPSTTLTVKSTNDNGYALTRPSDATMLHWRLSTTETGGDAYTTRYNTFNNEMLFTTYASGGTGGNIIWRTGSSGAGTETERMRITSGGNVGINTQTPNATFDVAGSVAAAIAIKTATYTLTSSDYTVVFDLNGNATANLPDATTCKGRIYVIKINRTNVADTLTIDPNGAQTIDGNATYDLQCQQAITIQSDGSNWRIIGDYAAGVNCL